MSVMREELSSGELGFSGFESSILVRAILFPSELRHEEVRVSFVLRPLPWFLYFYRDEEARHEILDVYGSPLADRARTPQHRLGV